MEADDDTHKLLQDIRDAQREHLAEYRRVTQQSLDLQQRANVRQEQFSGIYKRVVLVGGVLVAVLLGLVAYILVRLSPYLAR
jgi:hypothetical protein